MASFAVAAGCQPDDPTFGPPGSIKDRRFPGEVVGGGDGAKASAFPGPFDAANPPPEAELATRHAPYAKLTPRIDCMTCHVAGGTAQAKPWLFGGHVTTKTAGAIAEVIVTTKDRKTLAHVKASTDGYVWSPLGTTPLPPDALAAVRTKDDEAVMQSSVSKPACNAASCHGGTTPEVTVPP